jgi:ABC-type transport system substrate-binding protein/DNA-binding SARP family transcriptional activator
VALEADGLAMADARFPGRQSRLLFAYLVVEQGRPAPRDELAQALWGDAPPPTWEKALTVLVSKLRAVLTDVGIDGASSLTGAFGCYRLQLPEGSWVDVLAAANAADDAERALAAGDLRAAKTTASSAESLTRSTFLPGEESAWVGEKRRELADVRARALNSLAEACLRSGAAREAASWADQAIELEPFRETGYRLLMQAHAAAGNRAEGLRTYERCRRLLADELGAYPSPETESIYRRMLEVPRTPARSAAAREEGPEPPTPTHPPPGPGRPLPAAQPLHPARFERRLVGGVAVAALAVVAAVATTAVRERGPARAPAPVPPNTLIALGRSGAITATVAVGARPVALASMAGSLWVANADDQSVTRVDVPTGRAVRNIPVGGAPTALAAGRDAVWLADGTGDISRIDPVYDSLTPARRLSAAFLLGHGTTWPILGAFDSIWIANPDGYVTRLDTTSGRQIGSVDIGNEPSAIAAGDGSVWITNRADGTVSRIDPLTMLATTIPVGHGPAAITVNAAGAWVANAGDGALVRIDPDTNAVAGMTRVGSMPTAVVAGSGALWVTDGRAGTVMRLDPRTGQVTKTVHLGGSPTALLSAAGRVWVTVAPASPPAPAAGGEARITVNDAFQSLDPALASGDGSGLPILQLFYATCANLVTYPDEPAPAGSEIVPEVADAVPAPTEGGRTYTFTVRPGFRFSPPSNEPVTAQTFKSTIERVADPRLKSPFASQFSGIVGYHAYVTGHADGLRGVVAHGATLTIKLAKPDGTFLAHLASGAACAVPSATPAVAGGLDSIPSAGPYYVASYTPGQQLVLRRNPNYHGNRPHRFNAFVITIGVDPSRALTEIETGQTDYALDGLPRDAGPKLAARYGPGSAAAEHGRQQYFISPADGMRLLHMNTSRPLFSDVRLRRAVNYAIDRPALTAQGRRFAEVNPFNAGEPTGDYLPPPVVGATDLHLYPTTGPDLRRAKELAGHRHAAAIMYTADLPPWLQEAQIIRRDLRPLGIDVRIKQFPINEFFDRLERRGEPFDLAVSGWAANTTDPSEVLGIFDGSTIQANNNYNFSYFRNAGFDRRLHVAAELTGPRRYEAYRHLERELERDFAPAAAFATDASRDFFSARIGCQLYEPVYGIDLAALCLRT